MKGPIFIKTYDDPVNDHCPCCGSEVEAATSVGPTTTKPYPGALTICLYCGEILKFDEKMKLAMFPLKELLQASPEKRRMIDVLREFVRSRKTGST